MVAGNQRQVPVIQTSDGNITQIQQNSNKVLRNLSISLNTVQSSVLQTAIVGEIKIANLTLAQFQSVAGSTWVLANGGSCVDTDYSRLTGNNIVPNLSLGSINNFIKVNQ